MTHEKPVRSAGGNADDVAAGSQNAPACTDATVSMERANGIAAVLLPALALGVLGPFWLVHGWPELASGFREVFRLWLFIPAFLVAIVGHEALHGLGFLLVGRVPRDRIHFGIHRGTLSPFAGCRAPVSAGAYRITVALPAIVLGLIPLVVGYATGWGAPVVWGFVMLVAAGGDLIVLWAVRSVPAQRLVLDHPERVGCLVLDDEVKANG
jgi:hypothetical protein